MSQQMSDATVLAAGKILVLLREYRRLVPDETLDKHAILFKAADAVGNMFADLSKDTPLWMSNKVLELQRPYNEALLCYSAACERRRGRLRSKGQPTEAEFQTFKLAVSKALDQFVTWFESIEQVANTARL